MNPFDPKAALLAKHAQHVVLIHFPIALFITGVVLDMATRWTKSFRTKTMLANAARINIAGAAISVVPVIVTGLLAWQWQFAGKRLKGILLLHLTLGAAAGFLICLVAWMHSRQQKNARLRGYFLPLEILAMVVVALAAHVGGFLSGVNLPG